jgi:repressor LexA
MHKLTLPQEKALDFIRTSVESDGVAPTLREICAFMGYKAIGSAQDVVGALRRKGYLEEKRKQTARTYILTQRAKGPRTPTDDVDIQIGASMYSVPLLGRVPAGNPALAVEERIGTLQVSLSLLSRPYPRADDIFALQATGESMIGAGILDGDFLVVKQTKEPASDSIVVARVDGDVTVKRLRRHKQRGWYLQPENPKFANIYATTDRFEMVGQVIALQRSLL